MRIESAEGALEALARVGDRTPPGVVALPFGLPGVGANTLTPDTLSDAGGGSAFHDARVEVSRA